MLYEVITALSTITDGSRLKKEISLKTKHSTMTTYINTTADTSAIVTKPPYTPTRMMPITGQSQIPSKKADFTR